MSDAYANYEGTANKNDSTTLAITATTTIAVAICLVSVALFATIFIALQVCINLSFEECFLHIPRPIGSSPSNRSIRFQSSRLIRFRHPFFIRSHFLRGEIILVPDATRLESNKNPLILVSRLCRAEEKRTRATRSWPWGWNHRTTWTLTTQRSWWPRYPCQATTGTSRRRV